MTTSLLKMLAYLVSILLLAGCAQQQHFTDLENYVTNLKKQTPPKAKISILSRVHFPKIETYQATNMREPFLETASQNKGKILNPILSYPVSMLRFIGTLTNNNRTTAFVLTPDNMLYQVNIGDAIGTHYGKITQITDNEIKINETELDDGKIINRVVTLELKDEN